MPIILIWRRNTVMLGNEHYKYECPHNFLLEEQKSGGSKISNWLHGPKVGAENKNKTAKSQCFNIV